MTLQTGDNSLRCRLMKCRIVGILAAASTFVVTSTFAGIGLPAGPVSAAPAGNDQVVAFVVRGVGNGHGRGLSQWGAYGRAVNGGQSWQTILDAYYGGTTLADHSLSSTIRVRLLGSDDATTAGVISASGTASWNGSATNYASLYAIETGQQGHFDVWSASTPDCPGAAVPWTLVGDNIAGPIVFSTSEDQTAALAGSVLGLCQPTGAVTHYRGTIEIFDISGVNRVVNQLDVENYLRGVVPKEVSASWGAAGNRAGMNALRAQAVAARSFGLSQNRYSYAKTCDSSSCQVYGGAATRATSSFNPTSVEQPNSDMAIAETAGKVRLKNGVVVSTEFSASNGPRTAGGAFPPVDDPWDDVPTNPNHRWTRIIDADDVRALYGLATANGVVTAHDSGSQYDGIWANEVRLGNGATESAWNFRNAFALPSPGFELIPVRRTTTSATGFALIGDSVGESVAGTETSVFRSLVDGVHASQMFDAKSSRRTQGGTVLPDGVGAAGLVPLGTDLVIVELGYNDDSAAMPGRIDAVMAVLRQRGVGDVAWVNLSERRPQFAATNVALNAAMLRWSELTVLDWESASDDVAADRWYSDNVHLTSTGRAEFSLWLREVVLGRSGRPVVPSVPLWIPVLGRGGVPTSGVVGVALNVTAVNPVAPGWLRVWPCGSPEPTTSSVNFMQAGAVEPNGVVVPIDSTGAVCVKTLATTDVIVDVAAWFVSGLRPATGRLLDTREGLARVLPGTPLKVNVLNQFGVPAAGAVGVALNVTAVNPVAPGHLRVWSCGSPEPETSSVNYMRAGAVEPNGVVVPVDQSGDVCISSLVETDVVVDVAGWFDSGLKPATGRLFDTRDSARVMPGVPLRVDVLNRFGVPATGAIGVALNVTAVNPVAAGYLRVWPCASPEPETSSVNYMRAGAVEPNGVVVPVIGTGEVCVSSLVETDVVVDVAGWFDSGVRGASGARIVDTRYGVGPIPGR